ncbi:MAG: VanZ family protein [Rikenellaceae bacterium]
MLINSRRIKLGAIMLTVLYLALITTLSLVKFESEIDDFQMPNIDKLVHFCFYLGLNFLILSTSYLNLGKVGAKCYFFATAFCVGYSALIEFVQNAVGRHGDIFDLFANSLGAVAAIFFVRIIFRRIQSM